MTTPRLLIVDDEREYRDSLVGRITEEFPDWSITASAGANDAVLTIRREEPFDVVLTAMRMSADEAEDGPSLEVGSSVVRAARERDLYTEIIVMSVRADLSHVQEALARGADQYLDKSLPDSVSLIAEAVRSRMRRVRDLRIMLKSLERWGEILYDRQVKDQVEPGNRGAYVVMDLATGEYEVDEDSSHATERLLSRLPDAVIYIHRLGEAVAEHAPTTIKG